MKLKTDYDLQVIKDQPNEKVQEAMSNRETGGVVIGYIWRWCLINGMGIDTFVLQFATCIMQLTLRVCIFGIKSVSQPQKEIPTKLTILCWKLMKSHQPHRQEEYMRGIRGYRERTVG